MKKKRIVSLSLIVALIAIIAGGTYAYFTDDDDVTNEFTVGNINIELKEPNFNDKHLIPGKTVKKDPTVTVKEKSEDSYVFMYVDNKISHLLVELDINEDWGPVEGTDNLYVNTQFDNNIVKKAGTDRRLVPLFNEIIVLDDLDNEQFKDFNEDTDVINIMAFAHQAEGVDYDVAVQAAKDHFGIE
ncbi:SipW-dependent-type signal peptide-containing protein [Marinilactibacillus psychrotolerans]|uniref:TasA family protein n=1 Tax=Marinilactibacillus psychrotolerans TaxID=191770 RepID=A0ABW8US44_9LACT